MSIPRFPGHEQHYACTLLTLIVLLLHANGCHNNSPEDYCAQSPHVVKILGTYYGARSNPGIVSGASNMIVLEWKLNYTYGENAWLSLYSDDGTFLQLIGPTVTLQLRADECQKDSIPWDGRVYAAGYNTRTRPIPLGRYKIEAHIGLWRSDKFTVQVRANAWDQDGDDISDAVEGENNKTTGIGQTPIIDENGATQTGWYVSSDASLPRIITTTIQQTNPLYVNRGMQDYSLALGSASIGSLHNGLRLAHESTGYYYFRGADPIDTDNWAVLHTLNHIERVGRQWSTSYPNSVKMGVGDISLSGGGYWQDHPGGTHQRGLDVDMRYIRADNLPESFSFNHNQQSEFDSQKTYGLLQLFVNAGARRIIVDARTGFAGTSVIVLETPGAGSHYNHFHVEFWNPNGTY
jgi:hypothetical protein